MPDVVLAAILLLAPHVEERQAENYAGIISEQASAKDIDPLLVVAIAYHESKFRPDRKSKTDDYGLMQVHVSRTTHRRYLGKEHLLFDPALNIRLGVRILQIWRKHHFAKCKGRHHWWGHYKYGARVRSQGYGQRVWKIYKRLLQAVDGAGV